MNNQDLETIFNSYTFYQLENKELYYIVVNNITKKEIKGSIKHILNLIKTENNLSLEYRDLSRFFETYLNKIIIYDISFKPVEAPTFERDDKTYFNVFKPNEYMFKSLDNPLNLDYLKSNCPLIFELLNNLCSNEEYKLNYLLTYLSWRLRNPNKRAQKLFNLYGEEAAGKGLLFTHILKPLFKYAEEITKSKLLLPYDNYKKECLILYINECEYAEQYEELLKSMLTSDFQILNTKKDTLQNEPLCFDIFSSTNSRFAINAGLRRGIYFKSKTIRGNTSNAQNFADEFILNYEKEFPFLVNYLQSQIINSEIETYIMKGLDTEEAREQREILKSLEDLFIDRIKELNTLDNMSSEFLLNVNSLNKYLVKTGYIKSSFFLDCFNGYRKQIDSKLTKQIQLNRFGWFWERMNIKEFNQRLKFNNALDYFIELKSLVFTDINQSLVFNNIMEKRGLKKKVFL